MVLKHLLLGLGGSVAVGGIGYGIYSFSQSSKKESTKDTENSGGDVSEPNLKGTSGDQNKGSEQPAKVEDGTGQGQGDGDTTDGHSKSTSENSSPQSEESLKGDKTRS